MRVSRSSILIGLLTLVLAGCETSPRSAPGSAVPAGVGRLVLTLNGPQRSPVELTAELTGIMLRAKAGGWFEVPMAPVTLDAVFLVGRQLPLADAPVPAGMYDRILLKFGRASVRQEGKTVNLSVPPGGFPVEVALEIQPGSTAAEFLTWDLDRAIEQEATLAPAFGVEPKAIGLRTTVAYVTNEESGTVSVLDRATGRAVASIQVGRGPRGIVVSPDLRWAYVLNGGGDSLTVIDVSTQRPLHTTNLELHAQAREMAISGRGNTIYIANTVLNSVSILDAENFGTIATIPVGISPVSLALDPRDARLLVVNQGSNSVSLIDTLSRRLVGSIPVEPGPTHVSVDSSPGMDRAYVASPLSTFVTVIAPSTSQVLRRLNVGPGAVATFPDRSPNRLFVVKEQQNRVTLYDMTVNAELGSIPVGRRPHRIALDPDRDKLYVVNRDSDSVTVLDRVSRRVETTIPVGKRPYGVAILR